MEQNLERQFTQVKRSPDHIAKLIGLVLQGLPQFAETGRGQQPPSAATGPILERLGALYRWHQALIVER